MHSYITFVDGDACKHHGRFLVLKFWPDFMFLIPKITAMKKILQKIPSFHH